MGLSYFDVGDHTYFVVPSDPDGFVILDLGCGCETVDEDGEVEDNARCHYYATEREAEEAILRWKRREDDREGSRRTILLFEGFLRARAELPPKR